MLEQPHEQQPTETPATNGAQPQSTHAPTAPATETGAAAVAEDIEPTTAAAAPATTPAKKRRRIALVAVGAALALAAGGAIVAHQAGDKLGPKQANLLGGTAGATSASPLPATVTGKEIAGPLNLLIVGIDPRESVPNWQPHADAILLLHVPATHDAAYLYSLPRDLLVNLPAFPPTKFPGQLTKLTHAMSFGSMVPGKAKPNRELGFQLLARSVSRYTGIAKFDGGAVLDFGGLIHLVNAVGGVDMKVDQKVVSIHNKPNGQHRAPGNSSTGYVGPQMVYKPGMHHFTGWEALDYGRQRYLPGGDYTRQKHQQQLIRAIIGKLVARQTHTNPVRLGQTLAAVHDSLTFDGNGHTVYDFAYTLRRINPARITLIDLPGGGVGVGNAYQGEALQQPTARQFFVALRTEKLAPFLASHPKLVHSR